MTSSCPLSLPSLTLTSYETKTKILFKRFFINLFSAAIKYMKLNSQWRQITKGLFHFRRLIRMILLYVYKQHTFSVNSISSSCVYIIRQFSFIYSKEVLKIYIFESSRRRKKILIFIFFLRFFYLRNIFVFSDLDSSPEPIPIFRLKLQRANSTRNSFIFRSLALD
jgi:hypothetical protein